MVILRRLAAAMARCLVGGRVGRVGRLVVLACALMPGLGRAAPDPSLRLYFDFESFEVSKDGEWWTLPDRSPNGFDVEFKNCCGNLSLVPTEIGHALQAKNSKWGVVLTDGVPIYRPGESVTLSLWARGAGEMWPLHVSRKGGGFGKPLAGAWIAFSEHAHFNGMRWQAWQGDGVTRAFNT